MKYFLTEAEYDHSITGTPSTKLFAVKINPKNSFKNDDEKKYFYDVFASYSYAKFDNDKISEILFFPVGKKIKQIDVIRHSPRKLGLDFIVSKKVLNTLKPFKLPESNIIPVKIATFTNDYFLIGFSVIQPSEIDLSKSVFSNGQKNITFNTTEEYNRKKYFEKYPVELHLKNKFDYDIINIQMVNGLYFSEKLVEAIEDAKIIGFKITKDVFLINE